MNPVPVWVHVPPLARLAVKGQSPRASALAINALASQGSAEQAPAVNVPSKHDEAVHVNPVPVWVHVPPLARLAVKGQSPRPSASAINALA